MKNMNGKMTKTPNDTMEILQFNGLGQCHKISHFITTRSGGVSQHTYNSFNLGEYCGDEPDAVQENRRRLCESLSASIENLFVPFQIHRSEIALLDQSFLFSGKEKQKEFLQGVDALITNIPNTFIAVTTADCVPVLLYDPDKHIVAAVHAGWRGTALDIVIKTVRRMEEAYGCSSGSILAGIGPSIGKEAFEVGEEVRELFTVSQINIERFSFRNQQTGKLHLDLWEANRLQLIAAGVQAKNIEISGLCTYSNPEQFFSARKSGVNSGRMLSGIGITEHL